MRRAAAWGLKGLVLGADRHGHPEMCERWGATRWRTVSKKTSSLRSTVLGGVRWTTGSQWVRHAVQGATLVLLARLLSPADFGLVGMATVFTGFVGVFRDFGITSALVQRRGAEGTLLSSIFWLQAGLGIALSAALCVLAPWIGELYREPRVVPLVMAQSATVLLLNLGVVHHAMLIRDMRFPAIGRCEIVSALFGGAAGVGLAWTGAGVWSLVGQAVATAGVWALSGWVVNPWRPRMVFRVRDVRSVAGYGLNLTGVLICNFIARNADNFLIGRFLGAQSLGLYELAYRLMLGPLYALSYNASRVLFPAFARLQGEMPRFRRGYLDAISSIALVTFPISVVLLVAAGPVVRVFFGEAWRPAVPLLMILAPVGMAQSVTVLSSAVFRALGRTALQLRLELASAVLLTASFAVGLKWGLVGVATAYVAAFAVFIVPHFLFSLGVMGLRFSDLGRALWRPLACSALLLASLWALRACLPASLPPIAVLVVLLGAGGGIYAAAALALNQGSPSRALELFKVRS